MRKPPRQRGKLTAYAQRVSSGFAGMVVGGLVLAAGLGRQLA
jgi:hypothetical protein